MSTAVTDAQLNAEALAELPAAPTPLVFVLGAGPVGTALAARLTRAGVPVAGVHGRLPDLSEAASAASGALGTSGDLPDIFDAADVVILSVRDSRVREVTKELVDRKRLRSHQILLHTSGNWPAAELLGGARSHVRAIGTLHPLMSLTNVPRGTAPLSLQGAAFGIEGDDLAREACESLVRMMGGQPMQLQGKDLALYHAGAVIASNYVIALADVSRQLFVQAGVPEAQTVAALVPLLRSVVANLEDHGLPGALTGPAVRGDAATVESHLAALQARGGGALELYQRLGIEALRIARQKNPELSAQAVDKLGALFGGSVAAKQGNGVHKAALRPVADEPAAKKRR